MLVAGALEGRDGGVALEELLALELAAAADLAGLARQRPAAEQVLLEDELDEARGFGAAGALLEEKTHPDIVAGGEGAGVIRFGGNLRTHQAPPHRSPRMRVPTLTRPFAVASFLACFGLSSAEAAFFIVNSTQDVPEATPGDGTCDPQGAVGDTCTLRAAIMEANALGGSHTIVVASGQYPLTRVGNGEEAASTGDLDILADITLTNATSNRPLIQMLANDRVFDIHPGGSLSLLNLSVIGGYANSADTLRGGAFQVQAGGTLHLERSVVSTNIANVGGAIYSDGEVSILDSELFNNALIQGGFLLDEFINGAAILTRGTLSVERSSLHANGVIPGGEGLTTTDYAIHARTGGAVDPSVSLVNTTVAYNTRGVQSEGVPLELRLVTIAGNNFRGLRFIPDGDAPDQLVIWRSAIVGNTGKDCGDLFPAGWNGISNRANVSSDQTCGFTGASDRQDAPWPFFDDLDTFGGRTPALMPMPGSVVIDLAVDCLPAEDQRERPRPLDGDLNGNPRCDAGAIEYDPDSDPILPDALFGDGFED